MLYNPHVDTDEKFDMKRVLKAGTVIALFLSTFAFAQVPASPENKSEPLAPPDPPLSLGKRVPVSTTARYGGIEVTTDTQGVDFGPYLQVIAHQIKENWYSIIPPTAMAPLFTHGKVVIEFAITKNGQIAGLHYAKGSGDVALDRAAYGALTLTNPFPPLPSVFPGQYLGLRMSFLYNPRLNGISPSGAQIRAGSSLQFSPVLKGITQSTDSVVTWSINGEGCIGAQCGTISEAGLYTAPLTVPENPHITVKATAPADLDETVSTVVTIVAPEPLPNDGPK